MCFSAECFVFREVIINWRGVDPAEDIRNAKGDLIMWLPRLQLNLSWKMTEKQKICEAFFEFLLRYPRVTIAEKVILTRICQLTNKQELWSM